MNRAAILTDGEAIGTDGIPGAEDATNGGNASGQEARGDDSAESMSNGLAGEGHAPARATVPVFVGMTLAQAERALILATLEHNDGARDKSAQMLGISAKTLYNRLRQYDE
ncbi:MAG: helix-turn-helix domain-containing protein [Burkholderiaceae bacterium]